MSLEFPEIWTPYSGYTLERLFLCKVYHIYKERNEWVNWHGDTGLVDRTNKKFFLSFKEFKEYAEKNRAQGTRFVIDEVPSLCMVIKSYRKYYKICIMCTELYKKDPFSGISINIKKFPLSAGDILSQIDGIRWFCFGVFFDDISRIESANEQSIFLRWISKPSGGGKKVPLGWTTRLERLSQRGILKILSEIKRSKDSALNSGLLRKR